MIHQKNDCRLTFIAKDDLHYYINTLYNLDKAIDLGYQQMRDHIQNADWSKTNRKLFWYA